MGNSFSCCKLENVQGKLFQFTSECLILGTCNPYLCILLVGFCRVMKERGSFKSCAAVFGSGILISFPLLVHITLQIAKVLCYKIAKAINSYVVYIH